MNTLMSRLKQHSITLAVSLLLMGVGQNPAQAAQLALPDSPLFLLNTVEPNLLLTFDDSGSMNWSYLPDTISGDGGTNRGCSSAYNGLYFDPTRSYDPPAKADGTSYANMNFTGALPNGYTGGTAVNLSTNYQPSWGSLTPSVNCGTASVPGSAFYYTYNAVCGNKNSDTCYTLVRPIPAGEQQKFANWYSYYRNRNLAAKTAAGLAYKKFGSAVRVAGQHLNNTTAGSGTTMKFTTTVGVMQRFCDAKPITDPEYDPLCPASSTAKTDFYTRLYNSPNSGTTPLRPAMDRAGNSFGSSNTGNNSPYRDVPGVASTTSSPNPERACRKNFHVMLTDGYWNGSAGVSGNTDGTAHTLPTSATNPDVIPVSKPFPAGKPPYSDGFSGTLADNAFNYWYQDLRTDLENRVPAYPANQAATWWALDTNYWNPANDPATWQHMVSFTIGLGLDGTLPNTTATYNNLISGSTPWPDPTCTSTTCTGPARIDDLWHAALDSRGRYFSAKSPKDLIDAFSDIVGQVNATSGAAAGLGASGSTTAGSTKIFQIAFNSNNWSGRLMAKTVDANGIPLTTVAWEAGSGNGSLGTGLNSQNYSSGRNIFTYKPGTGGVPFRWSNLDATQQDALNRDDSNVVDSNGAARLDYLRGASANEGEGNPVNSASLNFRKRACLDFSTITDSIPAEVTCPADVGKLGDIIDSAAVYIGKPPFGYPDSLDGTVGSNAYSNFVSAQSSRTKMVYVGANDGMLHGFAEADGKELMAYVPNLVYASNAANNLALLTSTYYTHRYYVDGTPTVGDVFYGDAWHTVLVGGLRKGGRGYYALDITDPGDFAEGAVNATKLVKWEISSANPQFANLGYSYSQPTIIKMTTPASGVSRWAAIFGNGYNNIGTGRASLYVVDIATGALIREIDVDSSVGGGGSLTTPNGLGTPTVVDIDGDYIADYVYAGDLLGKMWRFDVRNADPANWSVSSIFTAKESTASTAAVQPITTRPAVGFHPDGFGGLMVYFGTGKYLESSDNSATGTQQTQTFYGVYDRGVTARKTEPSVSVQVTRADLLGQTISTVTSPSTNWLTRGVSNNPIAWRLTQTAVAGTYLGWYVNLPTSGERQVTDALLREGRIIFTTLTPSSDPCYPGGTGWLMELNTANGGQLKDTFDVDGNGTFTVTDRVAGSGVAGIQSSNPDQGSALSTPIVLAIPSAQRQPSGPGCTESKLAVSSKGNIIRVAETCTPFDVREGWRQRR